MARIQGFQAAVKLMESRLMGEQRRQRLIKLAHETIEAAAAQNRAIIGRDVERTIFVDGRRGAPVEAVKVGGQVIAMFSVHIAAVDFAWFTLASLSPIDTNPKTVDDIVYRDNHLLLVNGDQQVGYPNAPVIIQPDDVVTFVNTLPYARKIEGSGGRPPLSDQAPDGVYEVASEIVKAKFGNIVKVKFGYGAFLGASAESENRFPYLEISPKVFR